MERKTSDVSERTDSQMKFEGTTFAGTEVKIDWEHENATVDRALADFNETVRLSLVATENDEWETTDGSLAPVVDLLED